MAVPHPDRPDPPRRHRPRAQARRDALLRAAVEVAAERGVAGTTHRAVTERAGLPLATASYFFASIDDLVAEALRTFVAEEATRLEAIADRVDVRRTRGDDGGDHDDRGDPDRDEDGGPGEDRGPREEGGPKAGATGLAAALSEASMPTGPLPWALAQFETYLHAARDPAHRAPVGEAIAAYEHVAEVALLAAGAPPEAAAAAAPAFNALSDGFSLHHLARPGPGDVEALRRALHMLFTGLLVEQGEVERAVALARVPPPSSRAEPSRPRRR